MELGLRQKQQRPGNEVLPQQKHKNVSADVKLHSEHKQWKRLKKKID